MEYENTPSESTARGGEEQVLILVLMEYENTDSSLPHILMLFCLNPCSNGIRKYSL